MLTTTQFPTFHYFKTYNKYLNYYCLILYSIFYIELPLVQYILILNTTNIKTSVDMYGFLLNRNSIVTQLSGP